MRLALLPVLLVLAACSGASHDELPVEVVRSAPLDLRVEAEGRLKSSKAQPLNVPGRNFAQQQLVWMVPDGSPVKSGDVVAKFSPAKGELEPGQCLHHQRVRVLGVKTEILLNLRVAVAPALRLLFIRRWQAVRTVKDPARRVVVCDLDPVSHRSGAKVLRGHVDGRHNNRAVTLHRWILRDDGHPPRRCVGGFIF